jgi:predicted RNA-binding Zn-ribbon protein involved in translation (DUF1610 family)
MYTTSRDDLSVGCTYRFHGIYEWNVHMRWHEAGEDFKCDFPDCDKVYRSHVRSVHEGVRYKCEKCEDEFVSPKSLNLHEAGDQDG